MSGSRGKSARPGVPPGSDRVGRGRHHLGWSFSCPALAAAPAVVPREIQPRPAGVGSAEIRILGILKQNLREFESKICLLLQGKQSGVAAAEGPSHDRILGTRWGHSRCFGDSGAVMGSVPSFPQRSQPGAALLLQQICLLVTPGRAVGGRFGWNASGDCYDLHFLWQILNKHLGKALDSSWKIPAASRRELPQPRVVSAVPPGIVLPSVPQLSAARTVQERLKPLREPSLPQLLPPVKSQMRIW